MKTDETRDAEWVRAAVDRYASPLTRYAVLITGNEQDENRENIVNA